MFQHSRSLFDQDTLEQTKVLLCDADGNLFPSEEPAFVASTDVTNRFMAAYGQAVRFEPEQLRLATTGMNFRSTVVALALGHGIPVEAALLADRPEPTGPPAPERSPVGPELTSQELDEW